MGKSLDKEHPELFHYTGINGLEGILKSQTLWATHASFLNDSTELKEFRNRLPGILQPVLKNHLAQLEKDPANKIIVKNSGGRGKVIEDYISFVDNVYVLLMGADQQVMSNIEPYILSFCTPGKSDQIKQHGLLSQWRGYGREGGYAVVFDTSKLLKLLPREAEMYSPNYYIIGGDVVYSSDSDKIFVQEMKDDLKVISDFMSEFMVAEHHDFNKLFVPLIKCACRYKHGGFHEEKEVRIVALPSPDETKPLPPQAKKRHHYVREGTPVPCIHLFENLGMPLPITRIIVGPHRDKEKRKYALENLLSLHQLDITVSVSDIPYVGY